MPPPHGCPPFLIERAFSAMFSLKGDNKEKVGSMGMARGTSMSVALARTHLGEARRNSRMRRRSFAACLSDSPFSRIECSSRREPCISIIPPRDCAETPITATSSIQICSHFFREKDRAPSLPQKRCALLTPFPNAILIWGKTRIPNMCARKGRSISQKHLHGGSRQRRLGRRLLLRGALR